MQLSWAPLELATREAGEQLPRPLWGLAVGGGGRAEAELVGQLGVGIDVPRETVSHEEVTAVSTRTEADAPHGRPPIGEAVEPPWIEPVQDLVDPCRSRHGLVEGSNTDLIDPTWRPRPFQPHSLHETLVRPTGENLPRFLRVLFSRGTMANAARQPATYEDLLALDDNLVGEIVHGVLHAQPRPRIRHARASTRLGQKLGPPFDEGDGGPGGWILLDEPELHLQPDVLVPDLAGWRRENLPELPDAPFLTLRPDWVCEVLSPSTRALDLTGKREVYHREGVPHLWFVDPSAQLLEVLRWTKEGYAVVASHHGEADVRAEPFEAVPFALGALWQT